MRRNLIAACLAAALAACTSTKTQITSAPLQPDEEIVGYAEGQASGFMLFQIIPISQNDRFERAYQQAITRSAGARLINVTIWESWYWAWVGNGYTFHLSGTAVRRKPKATG